MHNGEISFPFQAMSSDGEIRLTACDAAIAQAGVQQALAEIRRIEHKYSRFRADSVLSRINAAAGSAALAVDAETAGLLQFAAQLHAQSGGLFDISSGVLRQAWDFKTARLPSAQTLAALRPRVGWPQVEWDGCTIRLPQAGMELDFGGFGKEYALDRAATLLLEAGLTQGFINLGGDIRVLGPQADGSAWLFGIQHPRRPAATIASIPLARGALTTSGDYERFFERDGRRYCHILDPFTGWPVTHWQSVSVSGPLCLAAGAVSTIAMLKGAAALAYLQEQALGYLAVDGNGQLHASPPTQ